MTTHKDKRILVVAEFAPGASGGDWVNIKQHFRGLDWNQVYWWSISNNRDAHHEFGGRHISCNVPHWLFPNQKWRNAKGWILDTFVTPYATRHLLSFIRSVEPDLIFFMTRGWLIPIVHQVMPQTRAHWHMALYDMPDIGIMVERLGQRRVDRFVEMANTIYRNASSRSVIGPEMAEEMRKRTGVECDNYFRCAVEPGAIERLRSPLPEPPDDVIRIGYAGSILAEPTFARLVKALQKIRPKLGRRLEVHLYGSQRYGDRDWFDPTLITEHGFMSAKELDRHYQSGTWGLSIMHLDDIDPMYNHFSFPCKFSMAIASGLPLICIGNSKTPLIAMARNYRVGIVLEENDADKLAESLLQGLEDFSRFGEYRPEILRCAETEVSAERKRQKLRQLLNSAGKDA